MVVVATNEEYILAKQMFKHHRIIKTGVGALNVIKKLKKYPRFIKIINFGYCGSNCLPIGTKCVIGRSRIYHPNVEFDEPFYNLNEDSNIDCYTSNDFVTKTEIKNPCVFDMELAYILALGFRKVESIKIVSDNLSVKQYENTITERD
jgi:hypothetical protein